MKRFYPHINLPAIILGILSITAGTGRALALDPQHYAQNSALSSGRWMKIKVSSTGMHLVSNADLKAMGFSNPDAVNVYGTGGRMVREALAEDMPDDLPLLPSVRTPKGIVFFFFTKSRLS